MTDKIENTEDIIDSRDVIERIAELERERDDLEAMDDIEIPLEERLKEWDETEEGEELKALKALADDAEDYAPDWTYGATLIRESYFVEYCEELVKDIGDMPKELPSYIEDNIDWKGVAEDLKVDYTEVNFDGVTYYIR